MSDDALLRALIDETVTQSVRAIRTIVIRPGTVVDADDLDNVKVRVDGDADPIICPSIVGPLYDGVRVMVLFNPPSGAMIFGYRYTGFIQQLGSSAWLPEHGALRPRIQIGNDGSIATDDLAIWIIDITGHTAIYIGTVGGLPVFSMNNDDNTGAAFQFSGGQQFRPLPVCPWMADTFNGIDANARPTTVSATYQALWHTVYAATTRSVYASAIGFTPVGTTADVRFTVSETASGITPVQIGPTTAIVTPNTNVILPITEIPAAAILGGTGSPVGRMFDFNIEMRRTGGAGTPALAAVYPLIAYPT